MYHVSHHWTLFGFGFGDEHGRWANIGRAFCGCSYLVSRASKRQRVTCSGRLACVLLSARPMGQKVSSGSAGLNFVRSYFIITSYESCLDTLTWLTYSLATNT